MVNVDKNIKPGVKAEPAAPKRRPRNQELNSSKKTLPDSIRSRRRQKLNCSRESVINQLVNEEQIYTQEEAEELINSFEEQTGATVVRLATVDEVENQDGEFWATKDGKTTLWCRGNGFWYDSGTTDMNSSKKTRMNCSSVDSRFEKYFDKVTDQQLADYYGIDVEEIIDVNKDIENANYGKVVAHYIPKAEYAEVLIDGDWESLDILDNGTVGFSLGEGGGRATRFYGVDIDTIEEKLAEAGLNSSISSSKKTRMNCSEDTKITTESGNEISMSEIKVVQNPSTNELALFIPENEEDAIPEGFTVIGDVVSVGREESENSGEDESEESEELDSSKKLNSSKRRSSKNLNSNRRLPAKKKK